MPGLLGENVSVSPIDALPNRLPGKPS